MKRSLSISLMLGMMCLSISAAPTRWALNNLPKDRQYYGFHDGLAVFTDYKTQKKGAIDTNGNTVIPATYKRMESFIEGASIVETDRGTGVINKKGKFLLQPDSTVTFYPVYGKNQYGQDETIPGLYQVRKKSNYKRYGYWYKNRMVLPIAERDCKEYFPFITWKEAKEDNTHILNLETGEILIGSIVQKGLFYSIVIPTPTGGSTSRLFTMFGEEVKDVGTSSKGVRVVSGEGRTLLSCCLVAQNGDTILPYKEDWYSEFPIWQNDVLLLAKRTGEPKDYNFVYRLYNADGTIRFETKPIHCDDYSMGYMKGKCIMVYIWDKEQVKATIYDYSGKVLLATKGADEYQEHIYGDWFYLPGQKDNSQLFCVATKKKYPCKSREHISDGMMVFKDYNGQFYIANVENNTCVKLSGNNIRSIDPFCEGASIVRTTTYNHDDYVIDKSGNIVMRETPDYFFSSSISEGVICVSKRDGTYGYLYNPQRTNTPIYGKTEHRQWLYDNAVELFNKKKYAQAKDKFYNLMINDPTDVNSIIYYGSCLNNLGYYDSAIDAYLTALKIEPDNEYANKYLTLAENNKRQAEQQQDYQYDRTMAFFDGLNQFLNVLGETFSQYSEFTNNMNSSRSSGYSSGSSNSSTKKQSGQDNVNKSRDARTYSDLESQLIKMNTYYNTYNDSQRRSIQSQMRSIRQKWESRGFRMFHSSWEEWDGRKR